MPGKKKKKKEEEEEERKGRKFDQQQSRAGEGSEQQEQRSRAAGGGDDDYAVSTPQFAALKVRKAWRRHLYMFAFLFILYLGFVFCNVLWMLLQLKEFFCFSFHFSLLQDFFFAAQSFSSFFPLSFFGSPPRDTWRVLQMQ